MAYESCQMDGARDWNLLFTQRRFKLPQMVPLMCLWGRVVQSLLSLLRLSARVSINASVYVWTLVHWWLGRDHQIHVTKAEPDWQMQTTRGNISQRAQRHYAQQILMHISTSCVTCVPRQKNEPVVIILYVHCSSAERPQLGWGSVVLGAVQAYWKWLSLPCRASI